MAAPTAPRVDVRRAADRFRTRTDGVDSAHSFSFGRHYDPASTSHGLLVAHNEERLAAGSGFPAHPHRDLEIVTWVLAGSLLHEDSTGSWGVVVPGEVQLLRAGSGVVHSERNDAAHPVRFVQAWVLPDEPGLPPGHEQRDVADLLAGGLVPVASGRPQHDPAVLLAARHAALHAARLAGGQAVQLPDAPYLHLFVAVGSVELEGAGPLGTGDAVRLTGGGGHRLTADEPAEVLLWEMHAAVGGATQPERAEHLRATAAGAREFAAQERVVSEGRQL